MCIRDSIHTKHYIRYQRCGSWYFFMSQKIHFYDNVNREYSWYWMANTSKTTPFGQGHSIVHNLRISNWRPIFLWGWRRSKYNGSVHLNVTDFTISTSHNNGQQVGVMSHTAWQSLFILCDLSEGRLISRFSNIPWLAHFPHLSANELFMGCLLYTSRCV